MLQTLFSIQIPKFDFDTPRHPKSDKWHHFFHIAFLQPTS